MADDTTPEFIEMPFRPDEWIRIYTSVKGRRDSIDRNAHLATWVAHEEIRLAILDRLPQEVIDQVARDAGAI